MRHVSQIRLRFVAVAVFVVAALCALTAGVLAKYISTTQEKAMSLNVVQWSSVDAGQVFPVDVYVRAYVTTGVQVADSGETQAEGTIIDGRLSMMEPTATSDSSSSWKTISGDPYCFYYVGGDGIVTGGEPMPTLRLTTGDQYKVTYEYLEAGMTDGNKLTCQAAWGVTIGAGTVTAA